MLAVAGSGPVVSAGAPREQLGWVIDNDTFGNGMVGPSELSATAQLGVSPSVRCLCNEVSGNAVGLKPRGQTDPIMDTGPAADGLVDQSSTSVRT